MQENIDTDRPLDKTRKQALIHWYNLLILNLKVNLIPLGICEHITYLYFRGLITRIDKDILFNHFLSIPKPKDANTRPLDYYWDVNNTERRIEFLEEIIKNLENEVNLQIK